MGLRLGTISLQTYQETEANREALQTVRDWLEKDRLPNMIIVGPVGSGKSYLMACACRALLAAPGPWPLWIRVPRLLALVKEGFTNDAARREAAMQVALAKQASVLFLDDLGKTHPGKDSSWVEDQLYGIVEERYSQMLPTVATTEFQKAGLIQRCGESVATRLVDGAMIAGLRRPAHPYRAPLA